MASHIQTEIKILSDKRIVLYDKYQDSYDEDLTDYTEEFPEEVDILGDDIYSKIKTYQEILPIEFIIEELTMLGQAPNILYDDNGHFAITGDGFQTVSTNYDKEDSRDDIDLGFSVKKEEWFCTIREALNNYLKEF